MLQWQQQPPSAGSLVARPSPKRPPSLQSEHRLPHGAAVRALIELQEYALYCKHVNTSESVAASKVHLLFCVEHRPCLLVVFNFSEVKL
jgi:hypothetical protein